MSLLRRALVIGVGVFLLLLPSLPAFAHAALVESHPADGSDLEDPPAQVRLVFSEAVGLPPAALRVFDARGHRVDRGDVGHGVGPHEMVVSLPDLRVGAYVVTWQAISEDGHPIRGAIVFQVGHSEEEVDESLIESLLGDTGSVPFATAAWILRWITYMAALTAVGGAIFLLTVGTARPARIARSVRALAVVAIVGSILQIPVYAAEVTGLGWSALGSPPALNTSLRSSLALAALVRSAALGLVFFSIGRNRVPLMLVGVVGVVVAEMLTGHTRTASPAVLMIGAGAVHVLTAAIWIGGLTALAISLRDARIEDDPVEGARMVGRFSTLALWSVAGITLAGLVLAAVQVGARSALTTTSYGWTLITKTALAVVVLTVAVYNNRVLVPAIGAGAEGTHPEDPGQRQQATAAWERLARTVRIELIGLVMVVGATALLVNLPPAGVAAGVAGPYTTTVPFEDLMLEVVVDPNRAGENEVHLYLTTPGGLSPVLSGTFTLELNMPSEGIGPIVRPLQTAGPAHFLHVGPELAIPGDWVITVRQRSQFDEVSVDVPVTVRR